MSNDDFELKPIDKQIATLGKIEAIKRGWKHQKMFSLLVELGLMVLKYGIEDIDKLEIILKDNLE